MKKASVLLSLFLLVTTAVFFRPFFLQNKLPIPADTIIGLYHPFRDLYAKDYPNGIPYKNFLITDPVRQQYPWRNLAMERIASLQMPLWNPYAMAGYPLAANFQTAAYYPFNVLFSLMPFAYSWSVLVMVQPVLAGLFLFLYMRHMKTSVYGSLLAGLSFALSGFSIAWLEWNTLMHTALWLPLLLLAKEHLLKRMSLLWIVVLLFSEVSMFFAGHLQTWFYGFLVSNLYLIVRITQLTLKENNGSKNVLLDVVRKYLPFAFIGLTFFLITAIQWIPTLQFISYSARDIDVVDWRKTDGWFLPWQHLVQFLVPDFFGNPTTLNYWGVWNYGELVGYIGIIPLLMACYALFFRRDKKTIFFGVLAMLALLFSLPTPVAKIPFLSNMPFLSTTQPTRLIFIIDFCLAILAGLGFDYYLKRKRRVVYPIIAFAVLYGLLWIFVSGTGSTVFEVIPENIATAKRNMLLPSILFIASSSILLLQRFFKRNYAILPIAALIFITAFDLMRFGGKFISFSDSAYLYPPTKVIEFLQKQEGQFRIMSTDSRILPPNFSVMYKLQTVDGYDPLYLKRYGEYITASERGRPDIKPPFGFNRIITPQRYDSHLIDMLGVKYVLSLSDIQSVKLKKVFQEGETRVYENTAALPRVYFVKTVVRSSDNQQVISELFTKKFEINNKAFVTNGSDETQLMGRTWSKGNANVLSYTAEQIMIETQNSGDGFLILADTFYPTWHASIDGKEVKIYQTNYLVRGIVVPAGKHTIQFYNTLFANTL